MDKLKNSEKERWLEEYSFLGKKNEYVKFFLHKDYEIGMHLHEFYEINVVYRGQGQHYLEDLYLPTKAGDVFVIPPMLRHGYRGGKGLDVYHILIRKNFFEVFGQCRTFSGFSMLFEIEPYLRSKSVDELFLRLGAESLSEFMNMAEKAEFLGNTFQGEEGENYKNIQALSIIADLCVKMTLKMENGGGEIEKCLDYISRNYERKITIDELAYICGMSRATFFRKFLRACKTTPNRYINYYRCKIAENLIRIGEKTMTEIACECGFYDLSHMNKCFQAIGILKPIS